MKLNIGCGTDYRDFRCEYWNIDISKDVRTDQIVDLEKKLPFSNNQFMGVLAYHVLEHINNFFPLMDELHRVCIPGTSIKIKTPFNSSWGWFNDPTHVRFLTPFTFENFKNFRVKYVKLNFGMGKAKILNWFMNPLINFHQKFYCRFLAWILPASEVEYELEVLK